MLQPSSLYLLFPSLATNFKGLTRNAVVCKDRNTIRELYYSLMRSMECVSKFAGARGPGRVLYSIELAVSPDKGTPDAARPCPRDGES